MTMTYHTDSAVCVTAVDVWQLDCGAAVAAVKDDKQGAAGWQCRYKCFVQCIAADLACPFVVNGHDSVVETRFTIAVGVFDLSAMTRVVEEVAGVWFRDQPVHCGEDILAVWIEWAARICIAVISHDYLRPRVTRVAFEVEELHHVRDILLAASKCML